ncbi:MAG: hypothetical protein AB1753_04350 [Thermoproteota archaeon]
MASKPPPAKHYPVSPTYRVLDGHDIYRSSNLIVALVVVESQYGRDMRLYRWINRNGQWKVDLCRMGVKRWDWAALAARAAEFAEKYGLKGDHQAGRLQQPDDNDD